VLWKEDAPYAKKRNGVYIIIILNLRTAAFKAYCAICIRRSNFRHQASPRVSPRESTQRRKVELWARNVQKFCLYADFHVTFRDLLHGVKLRHGTDGFTSPPKEGVLRIFFALKIRLLRSARCLQTTEAAMGYIWYTVEMSRGNKYFEDKWLQKRQELSTVGNT